LQDVLADDQNAPLARLFSLKHEFPSEWYRFVHPADVNATSRTLPIDLSYDRFPFQFRGKQIQIGQVDLFMAFEDRADNTKGEGLRASIASADTTSPGAPVCGPFSADPLLDGTPHWQQPFQTQIATSLNLQIAATDVNKIGDLIDDILMVCRYSVQ
jgi:hypothetical protein